MLSLQQLQNAVAKDEIDTVVVAATDMYGRLVGKRFDAEFFLDTAAKDGTHGCDYLLASDMEMNPVAGFEYASWERGFGDAHWCCDMSSLRTVSWHPKTAMVLCDLHNAKTHELVPVAPRSVLRRQIDLAARQHWKALAASELEYYTFQTSYRDAHAKGYRQQELVPNSDYIADYHILQGSREEPYSREFRRHLRASGVPVENTKAEAGLGQHELNVRYSDILTMADRHIVYKECLKEVADQMGVSVTFMAKPYTDFTGSGCHIHLSLWSKDEPNKNVFIGENSFGPVRCSDLFRWFLGGWLKFTPEVMPFYAPTINSYKRFVSNSWAPTRLAWSYDNRTAGFRVVGVGKSLRIECRIPGADANIYLAFAASLASGMEGIEQRIEPPDCFEGDIYQARHIPEVPKTLRHATELFQNSEFARKAFGDFVVDHYANFYRSEQAAFDRAVTDWERQRYFERI